MRVNEDQFSFLATKARDQATKCGYLYKKSGKKQATETQTVRLQKRWYVLYYNLLFYYESQSSPKPLGVIIIEGCTCTKFPDNKVFAFIVESEFGDQRQYFFVACSEEEREGWIESIHKWSGDGLKSRNDHLKGVIANLERQVLKEKEAKERLQRECADQWSQVSRLKAEVITLRDQKLVYGRNSCRNSSDSSRDSAGSSLGTPGIGATIVDDETFGQYSVEDRRKIIKLQAYIRGWLARKRFMRLLNMYILSPDGEKYMKRNRFVWQFVISEEDYIQQLTTLVAVFRQPLTMAADADYPACSIEEARILFSNCDVILMLHKMFLEGIKHRLKYWPNLRLDDYLSSLVSLLPVYHEYIRNHSSALRVLARCKQRPEFMKLLNWYESKPECSGQTIEQFLYYPVGLLPLYARILGQLIETTPLNDIARDRLQDLLDKVEGLHVNLNVQLSECESIKHTLEIERGIDGGCEVLLDADQKFIREGILRHYVTSKVGFGILREKTRHCFLFSRHLIITSRTANGKFRLAKICGKIPLKYTTLIEEVDDESLPQISRHLAFTLEVKSNLECFFVTLMAARPTDKAIWTSDISQCIYNLSLEDQEGFFDNYEDEDGKDMHEDSTGVNDDRSQGPAPSLCFRTIPIKDDPRLVTDSEDIRYAERLESNSLPQILFASVNRLIERLVDPRLPGTDFMDTFLVTYRYFTTGKFVLQSLVNFYNQLEEQRTGKRRFVQSNQDSVSKDNNDNVDESLSKKQSVSSVGSRDRTGSIMSTSSSMSSFDDYDSLTPLSPNDVVNFTTLTRRHNKNQWRDNPLSPTSNPRPRSFSEEGSPMPENLETDFAERGKTTPASFRNLGYQGSFLDGASRSPVDAEPSARHSSKVKEKGSPRSENSRESLSHATSDQSVSSLCSDEVSDRHLETLMECSNEGSQAGSYKEAFGLDDTKENGEKPDDHDVGVAVASADDEKHERGIDIAPSQMPSTDIVKSLHLDFKQKLIVKKHLQSHRPSLPAIFPLSSPEKESAKFFTLMEANRKAFGKGGKADKGKEKETKTSRSPSTSSSNESQNEDRRSTFYDMDDANEEKATTPKSMKKTLKAALNSKSFKSKENQPDSPKRKLFNFTRNKAPKNAGIHRSKSDLLYPGPGSADETDRQRRLSTLNRRSYVKEDDTQSLCSTVSLDDLGIRESNSDNSLKEKVSPKVKKGRTATLRLQKGTKLNDRKKRDEAQTFHRDEGRVSMRAFLPNRAPLKILNIMKHWVSKHNQDFDEDSELARILKDFFEDVKQNPDSLPVVKEIVKSMERLIDAHRQAVPNSIEEVLNNTTEIEFDWMDFPSTWSSITIANNLSILEHHLYSKISTREFTKCAWTKKDKEVTAPYITKISRRFNQVSGMVASEVINGPTQELRAQRIGYWILVAARCRDLNNFNSVLQITSGLMKSSVYRLKKSWELVNRQLKEVLNDLQSLVSADNCFAKMRETIHNCNPPCVPFIGFHLTDLLFMDERKGNTSDDGLVNFAKMSKISRAIREIRQYQQLRYSLDFDKDIALYLLAAHVDVDCSDFEDNLYEKSLQAEPRVS